MSDLKREEQIGQAIPISSSVADEEILALMKPILADLAKESGFQVANLYQLRHLGKSWKPAIPVLLRWLPIIEHQGIKEEIVRCLSVPWVGNRATQQLINEFERSVAKYPLLAWTIGNALSIVDVKGFEEKIIELSMSPELGIARQMLVFGLGRFHDVKAEEAAIKMLKDNEVRLHAIHALGEMKSKRAMPELEKLLTDKKAVVRKEARKAIANIVK